MDGSFKMVFKACCGARPCRKACNLAVVVLACYIAGAGQAEDGGKLCDLVLPELHVFTQHFANLGQTRVAYDLAAKQHAIAQSDCGCTADWPFEAFLDDQLGITPDQLTQADIRGLRDWSDSEGVAILRKYRAFHAEECEE